MRRAIALAILLYPRAWRTRYGTEFNALLEDVRPGWRELWDIVRGALRMQIFTWNWRRTAAAFALAGAVVAGVIAARTADTFVSTTVMKVTTRQTPGAFLRVATSDVLSRHALFEIIQQNDLYQDDRKRLPLEDIVQSMRNRYIRIVPVPRGGEGVFAVSFQDPDPHKAQRVTADIANRLLDASKGGRAGSLEILDPASLPQQPAEPHLRAVIVAIGLAAGLIVGFLVLGVRRWPLVAACGAAAAAVALAFAFAIPDRWVSSAVLRMEPAGDYAELLRETLAQVPPDCAIRTMQNGGAFMITCRHADRFQAQADVRKVVTRMVEQNVTLARLPHHNLEVLDPASFPEQPASPNRLVISALGLFAGLLAGTVVLWRRRPKTAAAGA
jgi:uncharacterized protein involved in exopolysaccharide biosynthesis